MSARTGCLPHEFLGSAEPYAKERTPRQLSGEWNEPGAQGEPEGAEPERP